MASMNMTGFKPVKFYFGQVHISGGHGSKPIPVTSKTVGEKKSNICKDVMFRRVVGIRSNRQYEILSWFVRSHVFVGGIAREGADAL